MIVGGGPAGSAAALTLTRYTGLRVIVTERSHYESPRIGETVSPAIGPLLDYLGVPDALTGQEAAQASAAAWGDPNLMERHAISSGFGTGLHLDRLRFDRSLADGVVASGATLLRDTQLRTAVRGPQGWRLELQTRERVVCLAARWVIEAGGRLAPFARLQGARHVAVDRLVGIAALAEDATDQLVHTTLVETTPEGWWYSAPVPAGRAIAVFMTDADRVSALGLNRASGFHHAFAAAAHTSARFAYAGGWNAPRVYRAESQLLVPGVGPGWIAAGDALAAFDPVSSLGIGHAIVTGIHAARVAAGALAGDADAGRSWDLDAATLFRQVRARARALYALEQRWPDAVFWARRQRASAVAMPPEIMSARVPSPASRAQHD